MNAILRRKEKEREASPGIVREYLYIEPGDPEELLRWRETPRNYRLAGRVAGYVHRTGYRVIKINGLAHPAHRLAWAYHYNAWPKDTIDHIDGNKSNNRIENLRDVTFSQNLRNAKRSKRNSSGVTGVSWSAIDRGWVAAICVNGRRKYIGYYNNIIDAAAARYRAERHYGFHQNHGRGEV